MRDPMRFFREKPTLILGVTALIVAAAAGLLAFASIFGVPSRVFSFESSVQQHIPPGADIAGWASFDSDSFRLGETGRYRIRVLWRDEYVQPDIDGFRQSVSLFPFESREVVERRRDKGDGVSEYVLEYVLQAVNMRTSASYQLPPPTVYYESERTEGDNLESLPIEPPPVHVRGYYPDDVSAIPLRSLKGEIRDRTWMRQAFMAGGAAVFLVLGALLVWKGGRRRTQAELSEPERLWRQFQDLDAAAPPRTRLLECERIFTRLLQVCTGMSPTGFWSGEQPADLFWSDATSRARSLLRRIYLRPAPSRRDAEEMSELVGGILSSLVEEERLQREQQPSFVSRLRRQPRLMSGSVALFASAALCVLLASRPQLWLSPEVVRYNQATRLLDERKTLARGAEQLTELGEAAREGRVKAAALYNSGTLASDSRLLVNQSQAQQQALLEAIFAEDVSLEAFLHRLDIDAEFEVLALLTESARAFTQGDAALAASARLSPEDEDVRRNLELLRKRRMALARAIRKLAEERREAEEGLVGERTQRTALVDLMQLMEMELPDEYSEVDTGKDDKGYHILEAF